MAADLCFASAGEIASRVTAGEISAAAVTEAFLERIAALDGDLGAYLRVDAGGARAQAAAVDAAVAAGEDPGPLAGVPVALKDALCTEGLETTAASRILEGWVPPYDATCVARLRAAGAVILGKTNMDEFAMGSSTESSGYRVCRNPWDLSRVPGGSSGGSAAAVAAGLCAVALGSDTGGSIRQPAAMCGVFGIKPTYGRVSRRGLVAFASSLDQVGPLARSAADAARVLEVIAGHDPGDSTSIDEPAPALLDAIDGGAAGLVVGVPGEMFPDALDPEVRAAALSAAAVLEAAGAELREISLPHTRYALATYYLIAPAEASSNLARYDGVRYGQRREAADLASMYGETRAAFFGDEVIRRIMIGTYALRAGYYEAFYGRAQKVRRRIKADFDEVFAAGVDLVLAPTAPTAAFAIGEKTGRPIEMYLADLLTLSCNLAGLPGASAPCGFTGGGLPIGLQLIGRPLGEATVLRAARAYEALTEWSARRPPFGEGA
jgi:aspartyl-tRNA(Asn)/glutamyl-tRNA(Gln) amidotransferase subunit A